MRVLLVRTSALGDIVQNLPVLRALVRARPAITVGWAVDAVFAPLLEGHPDLATVIPVPARALAREGVSPASLRRLRTLRRQLRAFRPDVAIDLMGNHKGAFLARLSGARRTIGARRADRREPSSALWLGETVAVGAEHAVDRGLELLAALGVDPEPVDFGGEHLLAAPPAAAADFLAARRRPFVVLQAGAGWGNKTYPPERWGEVARRLRDAAGVESWVPIAPGEEALAARVAAASDGAAATVDARDFAFLAALLRRAALVLGGDTGPVHLAAALGAPVLCVMGPTDPRRHGPYRAAERAVFRVLPCSFCHKRYAEPKACLLDLSAREVADRAVELLAAGSPPGL